MPSFGNRRPSPLIAVMVLLGLTMLMMTGAAGTHAATQKAQITINAQTAGGSTITGMYIELQQGGSDVKAGYTPITFTLTRGQSYQIEADNYGQYSSPSGAAGARRTLRRSPRPRARRPLTAIYGTGSSGGSGSTRGGSSSGPASITVDAQANGNSLNGMYVALLQGVADQHGIYTSFVLADRRPELSSRRRQLWSVFLLPVEQREHVGPYDGLRGLGLHGSRRHVCDERQQ